MKRLAYVLALLAFAMTASAQTGGIDEPNLSPDLYRLVNRGVPVRNETGGTLAVGTLLYNCGWSETYKRIKVCKADADVAGARAEYVMRRALTTSANGNAYKTYRLTAQNTNGLTVGDAWYLGTATAGAGTATAPTTANSVKQQVGRVSVVSATVGVVELNLLDLELLKIGSNDLQAGATAPSSLGLTVRASTALAAGDLVYLSSYHATDGYIAAIADADVANAQAQYVATGTIGSGATGTVVRAATITMDTTTSTLGNPVYLTITGTTTNTKSLAAPTGADDRIQIIGRVITVGASGTVAVDLSAFTSGVATNEHQDASITTAKLAAVSVTPIKMGLSCTNSSGGNYAAGDFVYVSSHDATNPLCALADADVANGEAQYVVTAACTNTSTCTVARSAVISAVNTSAAGAVGDPVYLTVTGTTGNTWSVTAPTGSDDVVQIVGRVTIDNAAGAFLVDFQSLPVSKYASNNLQAGSVLTAALGAASVTPIKIGITCTNASGGDYAAGDFVAITSHNATNPLCTLADADTGGAEAQYIVTGACTNGSACVVAKSALITGVDTSAAGAVGDAVYLTITGTTTNTWSVAAPTGADDTVQVVGRVTIDDAAGAFLADLTVPFVKIGTDSFVDGSVLNAQIGAAAAIDRSKLAEDALAKFEIPIADLRTEVFAALTLAEDADSFNLALGTNLVALKGEVTDNETETSIGYFMFRLPPEYVSAGDVKVRFRSELLAAAAPTNNGSNLVLACYEQADAAVGADLVSAGSPATYAALDTFYDKDFTLTAAGLVGGDLILCKMTMSTIDSEAGGGTITFTSDPPVVLADIKG